MERKEKSPEGLVDEVEAYVRKLPRKERTKIGGKFHAFYLWPEELPMKPDGWDNMSRDEQFKISATICDQLDDKAWSWKSALKYWYVNVSGRSEKEFRKYWRNHCKSDKEYNYMAWAYVMGICTGIQIALIIVRIVLTIKGVI